jgi:hypothetical protein
MSFLFGDISLVLESIQLSFTIETATMDAGLNNDARTIEAASHNYREMDTDNCPAAGSTELVKFTCRATEGLNAKFRLMYLSWKDDDQLNTV